MRGLACVVAVVLTLVGSAVAASVDVVTIQKQKLDFSGTVSNGAAGETVEIEFKRCEFGSWRTVAGAQTGFGGSWFVRVDSFIGIGSGSWRARWRNVASRPVVDLSPLAYTGWDYGRARARFDWFLGDSTQSMHGRPVELQRRTRAGAWVRVRTARLARIVGRTGYWFRGTFAIRTRGLTMRVFVPARTAAPCFRAWAGPEFRS